MVLKLQEEKNRCFLYHSQGFLETQKKKRNMITKKLKQTFLGLTLLGILGTNACAQERVRPENFIKQDAYYVTALDGSRVLVVADTATEGTLYRTDKNTGIPIESRETNFYIFFRDRDSDGFADSRGEMLYWEDGTSFRIREIDIPQDSTQFYNLEAIRKQNARNSK
jgi:hypothetical protein